MGTRSDVFLDEISTISNNEQSNEYFLKSLEKIESFGEEYIRIYLWSLINALDSKVGCSVYDEDKDCFKKWWGKLWRLSIENEDFLEQDSSDFSFGALNSKLGKLSHSIFRILWNKFPEEILKNEKIPEDIKKYFQVILKGGIKINPSVAFHFGYYLWTLWFLDKEWVIKNLKPLMNWNKKETICKVLWAGYLHNPRWILDFLSDFKNELFQLILNKGEFYKTEQTGIYTIGCRENIADALLITTGGREIENIFTPEENVKIVQNMDKDILEYLSRKIWILLKDSEDEFNLWSKKIEPWIKQFWPPQIELRTPEIAQNLSLAVLHCGEKLPEAFNLLEDKIKGIIQKNNNDIAHHIENNKKELKQIFNYPEQLLQILKWNFPENKILYYYDKKIKKILDELKSNFLKIEKNADYIELSEKLY